MTKLRKMAATKYAPGSIGKGSIGKSALKPQASTIRETIYRNINKPTTDHLIMQIITTFLILIFCRAIVYRILYRYKS